LSELLPNIHTQSVMLSLFVCLSQKFHCESHNSQICSKQKRYVLLLWSFISNCYSI